MAGLGWRPHDSHQHKNEKAEPRWVRLTGITLNCRASL